ncbi:hypothetical protein [Escherichia phage AV124]|nr:hypothetical protein [Escherichia phage AV124]
MKISEKDLSLLKRIFEYNPENGTLVYKWLPRKKALIGKTLSPSVSAFGYRHVVIDGRCFYHHVICFCIGNNCTLASSDEVDHKDLCKVNDKLCNLRLATKSQNMKNRRCFSNNKTGHKCIQLCKNGKYRVVVSSDKKKTHVGYFDDLESAILSRNIALGELHKDFIFEED